MDKKVCVATARDVGEFCKKVAKEKISKWDGFVFTENMNECDIFISVMYDKIVSPEFIEKRICYNFHPGILPDYRGAGTFSWSIVNGEKEAGITLHVIDEGIDSGDVIDIQTFPIEKNDTAHTLFKKGESVIVEMFTKWFERLLVGAVQPVPQDETKARLYYRKDLSKLKNLTRFVRALHFPGKESCYYYGPDGEKRYIEYKGVEDEQD